MADLCASLSNGHTLHRADVKGVAMTSSKLLQDAIQQPLFRRLLASWPLLLLRGVAATAFGVAAFVWPQATLLTLTFLFAVYAIVDGLIAIAAAFAGIGRDKPTWWLCVLGALSLIGGLLALFWPTVTVIVLAVILALWALISGAVQLAGALQLREEIESEWLLGIGGVILMMFGLAVIAFPGAGAVALSWMIAVYSVAFGVSWIMLSLKLRRLARRT